jgi:hypothetical protein
VLLAKKKVPGLVIPACREHIVTDVPPLTLLLRDYLAAHPDKGKPMSARAAAREAGDDQKYETFRLIVSGEHSGRIGEETVAALVRLGLRERDVRRAAGHQLDVSPGPFTLPARANRLTRPQREVIVSVVDAILAAAENEERRAAVRGTPQPRRSTAQAEEIARARRDRLRSDGRRIAGADHKGKRERDDTGT